MHQLEAHFRGYHKPTKSWYYGDLVQPQCGNVHAVILTSAGCNGGWLMPLERHAVDPASVGQYIGLHDKNGRKIFTGDIIVGMMYPDRALVMFDTRYATFKAQRGTKLIQLGYECEVIGTMYENEALLHGK